MARIYGRRLPRVVGAITSLEKNHPAESHYYLPFMGVEPESQGRGMVRNKVAGELSPTMSD